MAAAPARERPARASATAVGGLEGEEAQKAVLAMTLLTQSVRPSDEEATGKRNDVAPMIVSKGGTARSFRYLFALTALCTPTGRENKITFSYSRLAESERSTAQSAM